MPKIDLPFKICYVCGDRLTKKNVAGIYNKKFTAYCKKCHAEVSYCKLWRKKPSSKIHQHILDMRRKIEVLSRVIQRKETGSPQTTRWRAKMKRG
jgi:hypothetical protein